MKGQFHKINKNLREHPQKFTQYYRMSKQCFDEILVLVEPKIRCKNTHWRESISPEERLSVS